MTPENAKFLAGLAIGFGSGFALCLWLAIWANYIGYRNRARRRP